MDGIVMEVKHSTGSRTEIDSKILKSGTQKFKKKKKKNSHNNTKHSDCKHYDIMPLSILKIDTEHN